MEFLVCPGGGRSLGTVSLHAPVREINKAIKCQELSFDQKRKKQKYLAVSGASYIVSFKIKASLHDTLRLDVTMLKKKEKNRLK